MHARRLPARARDPRLFAAVLLVIGSMVVGGWLFARADDTEEYWAVARAVQVGGDVTRADLVAARVSLRGDSGDAYLRVDDELPGALDDLVWTRDHVEGALIGRDSWQPRADRDAVELPLAVAWGSAPDDLAPGDRVDVWVGPAAGATTVVDARRVIAGAVVAAVGEGNAAAGGALNRTVVVTVAADSLGPGQMLPLTSGRITMVRTR